MEIANYRDDDPKGVLKQILILTKTIHDNVGVKGAIKHYIEDHGSAPLWVLVNLSYNRKSFIPIFGIKRFREKYYCKILF